MIYRIKWVVFLVVVATTVASGQVTQENNPQLGRIDVLEHLGDTLPVDLEFTDEHGATVRLDSFFREGRPVVLILGYYQCPMLCNLVFNGLVEGIRPLSLLPAEDFQILTVSINPDETPQLAAAKKVNYLKELGKEIDSSGWGFLVGEPGQIEKLSEAVGFKYFYDTERAEYAHPAVVFVLTPEGVIARYLYGIEFKSSDLKLSLLEASRGRLGSTVDRLILYCFHYDPDSKGYVVAAGNVMKLGGLATLLVLGLFVSLMWYGERQRRHRTPRDAENCKAEVS